MPSSARPRTIASAFDPKRNGLTVLRLVLAAVVAVAHSLQLASGSQPVLGPATELGGLAVDAFFVISGFLVTGSLLRLGSARRYTWHRFLRIMPGFWACLIVTALIVAPALAMLSGRSPTSVFAGDDSAPAYLWRNALLLMRQFGIDGTDASVPGDGVINGSLWTLFYEAVCYGLVLVLGAAGLLTRRRWVLLALTAGLQLLVIAQAAGVTLVPQERLLRLTLMFLLGACALRFADRIPVHRSLGLVALLLVAAGIAGWDDYRAVGAAGFAYLVVVVAARSPIRWDPPFDLSYGLYVYHWPMALVLLTATAGALPVALVPPLVLLITAVVAAASWRWLEGPALRFKSAAWVQAPLPRWIRAGRRGAPGTRRPSPAARSGALASPPPRD